MANPKGHIATLTPYEPKGEKSLNKQLALKVDAELLAEVKSLPRWQDRVRAVLEELVKQESDRNKNETSAA